jgi:hypothetical protein
MRLYTKFLGHRLLFTESKCSPESQLRALTCKSAHISHKVSSYLHTSLHSYCNITTKPERHGTANLTLVDLRSVGDSLSRG